MFEWDKQCERLEVAPDRVRRLMCSLGDTQVALPGLPSQKSSAFLCAYEGSVGIEVVVVFLLHKSRRLAIYRDARGSVVPQKLEKRLAEALHFAESLGFLLDDMEFHLLSPHEQRVRWNLLPLAHGGAFGLDPPVSAGQAAATTALDLPSLEELSQRRRIFIEKLGRFMATL